MRDGSGYLAADALYDGPWCLRSAVAARRQRRRLDEVLEHDPPRGDSRGLLVRWTDPRRARGPTVRGVTTDASPLYSLPVALALGPLPPPGCKFHLLKELTQALWHALAHLRQQRAAPAPRPSRGRPRSPPAAQRRHRPPRRLQQGVAELFAHRSRFARHPRTAAQRATLRCLCRGCPGLRPLRAPRDEVYRLFDRRCRTDAALARLARLRRRVRRFRSLGKSLDKSWLNQAELLVGAFG